MVTPYPPGNPSDDPPWGNQPQGYGSPQQPQIPPPPGYPAQPGYPHPNAGGPSYPSYPQPGYPQPGYPSPQGYGVDPQAPFGRDPATGEPLSDKSATTAGLLQLFLGVFGIGRFYIDSTQIAVIQLCLGVGGLLFTAFCIIGLPVLLGVGIWALVDAITMFTGSVKDSNGRKLR